MHPSTTIRLSAIGTGSHSLRWGKKKHGQLLFDWTCRLAGHLKGYLRMLQGYGETFVGYNHRQTTVGLGISLVEWLQKVKAIKPRELGSAGYLL